MVNREIEQNLHQQRQENELRFISPIRNQVFAFVQQFGPVSMGEILERGKQSGLIKISQSNDAIMSTVLALNTDGYLHLTSEGKYQIKQAKLTEEKID